MFASNDDTPKVRWLLYAVAFVCATLIANWYFLKDDQTTRGTFGDMFGGVNAFFSGLAFAVLVFTLLQQRTELSLQRKELAMTREELAGQRRALVSQNELIALQSFESTFFQLLRLHNEIVHAIDLVAAPNESDGAAIGNRVTNGRDCFSVFYRRLRKEYKSRRPVAGGISRDQLMTAYVSFYSANQANLGHYFRSLYNMVKLVDRSVVSDKSVLINLIRAQLSDFEVALLFYNGLSDYGENFKPLIERYALLKHLDPNHVFEQRHLAYFSIGAFGKSSKARTTIDELHLQI
jgi:hypothetical protein